MRYVFRKSKDFLLIIIASLSFMVSTLAILVPLFTWILKPSSSE
jgi:hypothetical protein